MKKHELKLLVELIEFRTRALVKTEQAASDAVKECEVPRAEEVLPVAAETEFKLAAAGPSFPLQDFTTEPELDLGLEDSIIEEPVELSDNLSNNITAETPLTLVYTASDLLTFLPEEFSILAGTVPADARAMIKHSVGVMNMYPLKIQLDAFEKQLLYNADRSQLSPKILASLPFPDADPTHYKRA